ncbi:MAG: NAD(P)-dependent oxidoreductase [Gemmatimonadota bacterium]
MITFLGTGLLGANFVRALRRRKEEVHIWNRTAGKAEALATEVGATAYTDPADAVRGASRVHLAVYDDESVDAVLKEAEAGIGPDCIIVDHTTTSPAPTLARINAWAERGIRFQHAPVFMGPPNALAGTGTMLASGDRATFDMVAPALELMTGKLVYLGADPVRAAAIKLMGNLFLLGMTAGIADMFALGDALGVAPADATQLFEWFPMATMAQGRAAKMRGGDLGRPSWTLEMARKDARLMIESAESHGGKLAMIPAVAAEMDRWIASGHGQDDWMVIGSGPSK